MTGYNYFSGSWLGASAIGFYRMLENAGRSPAAIVRTDGANTTGSGTVAIVHFRVGAQADSLKINISGARGILNDGASKPLTIADAPPVDIVLAASEPDVAANIRTWPNPASTRLFVDLPPEMGTVEIRLLDELGRCVLARKVEGPSVELALGEIPTGTYRLLVLGENGVASTMVVVD